MKTARENIGISEEHVFFSYQLITRQKLGLRALVISHDSKKCFLPEIVLKSCAKKLFNTAHLRFLIHV